MLCIIFGCYMCMRWLLDLWLLHVYALVTGSLAVTCVCVGYCNSL